MPGPAFENVRRRNRRDPPSGAARRDVRRGRRVQARNRSAVPGASLWLPPANPAAVLTAADRGARIRCGARGHRHGVGQRGADLRADAGQASARDRCRPAVAARPEHLRHLRLVQGAAAPDRRDRGERGAGRRVLGTQRGNSAVDRVNERHLRRRAAGGGNVHLQRRQGASRRRSPGQDSAADAGRHGRQHSDADRRSGPYRGVRRSKAGVHV